MDPQQQLDNLRLAPLDSVDKLCKWLNALKENEPIWWRAIGWSEGYRYFSTAGEAAQKHYFGMLKRQRDVLMPLVIKTY